MATPLEDPNSSQPSDVVAGHPMPDQYHDLVDDIHLLSATFWMLANLWAEYNGSNDFNWQLIKFDEATIKGSRDRLLG